MIFPLLCYCFSGKRLQAARWTIDFLGFAFGISPYGRRWWAEGMRRADTRGRGHRGQRGAKGGQRTQGIEGGIGWAMQRGRGGRAADAPQRHISPAKATPTPPVSTPPLRWQTYGYPAIGPSQKLFPQN